jgi:hypothetical protein
MASHGVVLVKALREKRRQANTPSQQTSCGQLGNELLLSYKRILSNRVPYRFLALIY